MALMDDRNFLITHIRNSFITSDDTGMCELIIEPEQNQEKEKSTEHKRPTTWHGLGSTENLESGIEMDVELSHSPDIVPDMDFASHRRRSNTAQRLEKLKREKHKQSQIKHIQWKEAEMTVDEVGEYFEKKEVIPSVPSRKSALSLQLEEFKEEAANPFVEYARFDGRASAGVPIKKFGIFLDMCTGDARNYPMLVSAVSSAKIHELIGLICWQYCNEGHQPTLCENIEVYSLHIAEDDGEVDRDFPALDRKEPISKFGFAKLALVQSSAPAKAKPSIVVTINMPGRGFSNIPVENDNILMKELVEHVLKQRRLKQKGLDYRLESQEEAGVVIDLDKPLSAVNTHNFCLVRENSVRGDIDVHGETLDDSDIATSLSSHQYRSFKVTMTAKLGRSMPVQLGISGEKMEIDPHTKGRFLQQKAVTHEIESIANCNMLDDKISTKTGKSTFRVVYYTGTDFRHHDFECETAQAQEIVQKLNNIMDMRSSPVRQDYRTYKENKKIQNPFKKYNVGPS